MNCEKCGQEVCEHPMLWVGSSLPFPDTTHVKCAGCSKDFGPVRELIEKSRMWDETRGRVNCVESDLRAQIATLTRERDEASNALTRVVKERDDAKAELLRRGKVFDEWARAWKPDAMLVAMKELDAARARIAELEKAKDGFHEKSWRQGARNSIQRIQMFMTEMDKEVAPCEEP